MTFGSLSTRQATIIKALAGGLPMQYYSAERKGWRDNNNTDAVMLQIAANPASSPVDYRIKPKTRTLTFRPYADRLGDGSEILRTWLYTHGVDEHAIEVRPDFSRWLNTATTVELEAAA